VRTAGKVAAALGAVVLGVGAPVGFVVHGAGAPGRADSAQLWWERLRRLPQPVLRPPPRESSVRAGGEKVKRARAEAKVVEVRGIPAQSPVVAVAELGELLAVATFDGGAFAVERGGMVHRVEGVEAVNAVAFDAEGNLCLASDDGAFVAAPGERARKVAGGAFTAVAYVQGAVWFASPGGVARLDARGMRRWGADQGVVVDHPTSIAECGERICLGALDGFRELEIGADGAPRVVGAQVTLPAEFVTAVASNSLGTWVGTFDGGLVRLGDSPLTPVDGLPEGRIQPRAMAVVGDQVFAGTPAGLLVARGRTAALVPVGGEVSAVAPSGQGGIWVGLSGRAVRVEVDELSSGQTTLANSRNP